MPQFRGWIWFRLAGLLVVGGALINSGCLMVAAGVAAGSGAAAGYAYYKGRISRDYTASLEDTWTASHTALGELGMPIVKEDRDGGTGSIQSRTSDGAHVRIAFDTESSRIPAEGHVTRVSVRVGTLSFGDEVVSERILEQIGAHLAPAVRGANPAPVSVGPPQTAPPPLLPSEPIPVWQQPAQPKPGG